MKNPEEKEGEVDCKQILVRADFELTALRLLICLFDGNTYHSVSTVFSMRDEFHMISPEAASPGSLHDLW